MSGPKFQHWVPCGYLKHFAIDGKVKGRDSRVYVTTIEECTDKKIAKVGGENWTYSRSNPALDHTFNDMENDIPIIVGKIIEGDQLDVKEKISLMLIAFDLHHRSAAYDNKSSGERYSVYSKVSQQWLIELCPNHLDPTDLNSYLNYLRDSWDLVVLTHEASEKFVTSDHPSIVFADEDDGRPVLTILPVSPQQCIAIFDKERIEVSVQKLTDHDVGLLNGLQAARCIKEIYSDHSLDSIEEMESAQELLKRTRPERYFSDTSYRPDYYTTDSAGFQKLDSIKRIPTD